MNQRLKMTNLVSHIEEAMPNEIGPLKICSFYYEVLQRKILNFKEYR